MARLLIRKVMSTDYPRVFPDAGLDEVARLLLRQGEPVLVVGNRGELVGLVTEGDLVKRAADPRQPKEKGLWRSAFLPGESDGTGGQLAEEIMTTQARVVSADQEVQLALELMLSQGLKFLPVVDGLRVVGLLSRRDLLRLYLSEPRVFGRSGGQTERKK